eukprot:225023-Prymnesium_polylepis.1
MRRSHARYAAIARAVCGDRTREGYESGVVGRLNAAQLEQSAVDQLQAGRVRVAAAQPLPRGRGARDRWQLLRGECGAVLGVHRPGCDVRARSTAQVEGAGRPIRVKGRPRAGRVGGGGL